MQWPWRKAESELDREVQHHLETLADAYERQGLSRREAVRQAEKEFGGIERAKEECRDIRWWSWLTQVVQDLRFGWRMMRKTPAITVAAVASLALGIGATTSILSLADALLWRTLPVPHPEQLEEVLWEAQANPEGLVSSSSGEMYREGPLRVANYFSKASFEAMQTRAEGRGQVAGYIYPSQASASFNGGVVTASVRGVTGNFFPMLALQPQAGRLLGDGDSGVGAAPVVVVTHRFWTGPLGASADVLGQTLRINNLPYEIVGVLPKDFEGISPGDDTEIYSSIEQSPEFTEPDSWLQSHEGNPTTWWLRVITRRDADVTEGELRSALDGAFASSWSAIPKSAEATPHVRLADASRGLGTIRRQFGDPVWILLGLTALVLLVACANIANLLLARAASREKEIALRVSLGSGRARLVRQLLTESVLLAAFGGMLSLPVVALAGKLIVSLIGLELTLEPDVRSLAGAGVLTFLAALLFGLYPAWRATRIDPSPALKEGVATSGLRGRERWSAAKILVLAQVSLGVLLVSAAVLFTSHLSGIIEQDAGFERRHLLLFDLRPGEVGYEGDRLKQFYANLERSLDGLPGVEAMGLTRIRPMRGGGFWEELKTPGNAKGASSAVHFGNADFLSTLGVPILAGRAITAQECAASLRVAVISESLVQELDLASPLGATVSIMDQDYQVVGVAQQARYSRMTETPSVAYLPFDYGLRSATVLLRTSVAPLAALGAVREAVAELDRNLPLVDVYTMEQQISRTLQRERLFAWLCGSFGVLALVLCVVGLYGLMSHTTARRTSEMGIRRALGATRQNVMLQVFREAMVLAGAGMVLGVPLALYGAHLVESLELLPEGEWSYGVLAAALAVVMVSAASAALAPAARAASIEPMDALRRG